MSKDKAQRFREQNARDRKTVEWQQRQDQIRTRDGYTCRHCGRNTGIMLHIHHRYYVEGRRYWEYPDKAFVALCEECHDQEEDALFDAQHDLRRAIGWRDGEAEQMRMLARALDKAPDRHPIADIVAAIDRLMEKDEILDKIVEINRRERSIKPNPTGTKPGK